MKLKTLLFWSALVSAQSIFAQGFNGVYLGAGLGYSQAAFTSDQLVQLNVVAGGTPIISLPFPNNKHLTDTAWLGNIDLGFSKTFNEIGYLGLEATASTQSLHASNSPSFQERSSTFSINQDTDVTLRNEYAITINPGLVFQHTLLYGKLGVARGHFTTQSLASYSQVIFAPITLSGNADIAKDHTTKTGFRSGVGIEQLINENFSLKLEYINTQYHTVLSSKPVTGVVDSNLPDSFGVLGSNLVNSTSVKASNNTILLGLDYHFG